MDVVVIDYYSMLVDLFCVYVIIYLEYFDVNYLFFYLVGCGVVFKVVCVFLEIILIEMLDLVVIGMIVDMVSLIDENCIMVKVGFEVMKDSERIGL